MNMFVDLLQRVHSSENTTLNFVSNNYKHKKNLNLDKILDKLYLLIKIITIKMKLPNSISFKVIKIICKKIN